MSKLVRGKSKTKLSGRCRIKIWDEDGNLKRDINPKNHNLIVNAGENELGDLLLGVTSNILNNIGIGSGDTAAAETDTDLETALAGSGRQASDATGRLRTNNVITVSVFVGTGTFTRPSATVKEICVFFDPAATGNLFGRFILDVGDQFSLASGDTARLDYDVTIE